MPGLWKDAGYAHAAPFMFQHVLFHAAKRPPEQATQPGFALVHGRYWESLHVPVSAVVSQMWGQLIRNAREWIRLTAVYFPKELHPESLAYVQVLPSIKPSSKEILTGTLMHAVCIVPLHRVSCKALGI